MFSWKCILGHKACVSVRICLDFYDLSVENANQNNYGKIMYYKSVLDIG